jgi:hypothetical protein
MNKSIPKTTLRPGMTDGTHSRGRLIALHAVVCIVARPLPGLRIADRGSLETELQSEFNRPSVAKRKDTGSDAYTSDVVSVRVGSINISDASYLSAVASSASSITS